MELQWIGQGGTERIFCMLVHPSDGCSQWLGLGQVDARGLDLHIQVSPRSDRPQYLGLLLAGNWVRSRGPVPAHKVFENLLTFILRERQRAENKISHPLIDSQKCTLGRAGPSHRPAPGSQSDLPHG